MRTRRFSRSRICKQRAGARRLHAGLRQHLRQRGHRQSGLLEGALDLRRAPAPRPPSAPLCGRAGARFRPRRRSPWRIRQQRVAARRRGAPPRSSCRAMPGQRAASCGETRAPAAPMRSRSDCNQARSTYQGCGWAMATSGAVAAAAAISRSLSRGARHQVGHAHAERRFAHQQRDARRRHRRSPDVSRRAFDVVALAIAHAAGIHHHAAADRHHRARTCG